MRNNFFITFWERFKIPDGWSSGPGSWYLTEDMQNIFSLEDHFLGFFAVIPARKGVQYIFSLIESCYMLYLASITSLVLKWSAGGVSVCLFWLRPLPGLGRRSRGANLGASRHFLWLGQRRRRLLLTGLEVRDDVTFRDRVQAGAGTVGRVQSGCGVQGRTGNLLET